MQTDFREHFTTQNRMFVLILAREMKVAYGYALTWSAAFNEGTKSFLEELIDYFPTAPQKWYGIEHDMVKARINLAQVLQQMGVEAEKQRRYYSSTCISRRN